MLRKFTLALLSLLFVPLTIMAQNVTISPSSGSLVAGVGGANTSDSGKDAGFFTMWRHEQLALTMTISDVGNLTQAGDLADPSCVFGEVNNKLIVANGKTQAFIVVSLPKGYRITGYNIVLQPDLYGTAIGEKYTGATSWNNKDRATCFYETKAWDIGSPFTDEVTDYITSLSAGQYLAVAEASDGDRIMNPSADGNKKFTISRTAIYDEATGTYDMGNRLYFWVGHGGDNWSFSINSFELFFTAEGTFDAEVEPRTVGTSKNYVQSPFTTSKTDIGEVSDTLGRKYYRYYNVKDLVGYTHMYQANAVGTAGVPVEASGDIHPVEVNGQGHYAFGSNTYYIEPPTTINTATGQAEPIGFRIVGATFKPLWADDVEGGTQELDNTCSIYRTDDGTAYYLNSNLTFDTSASSSTYYTISVTSGGTTYYLKGDGTVTTDEGEAQHWLTDNSNRPYFDNNGTNYYIKYDNGNLSIASGTSGTRATINNGYIRAQSGRSYYLYYSNGSIGFSTSTTNRFTATSHTVTTAGSVWHFDEFGNMYIGSGEYKQYLACYGEGDLRSLSLSSVATGDAARWNLRRAGDGRIYYKSDSGNYYYLYTESITEGGATHWRGYLIKDGGSVSTSGYTAVNSSTSGSYTIDLPSYTHGTYTIQVYDKTGATVLPNGTIEITDENDADLNKEVSFDDFNNDAVKFVVTAAEGTQALIDIKLKLEALNPYIDQMTVVCTDAGTDDEPSTGMRLTQSFTASDFGVSGGSFHFNLPAQIGDHNVKITFEDLYSHYGDETYPKGTGNARYSFVTSPYFSAFDGVKNNKVTPTETVTWNNDATDAGLYDTRYTTNPTNQFGATIPSTHKLYTGVAGDVAFKFNNAETLTGGGSLIEYPFSVERYLAPTNQTFSDGSKGTGGQFTEIVMNASVPQQSTGTYYLFTADETRYNIAPTTAWEHRSYAFYRMIVTLATSTYVPNVKFEKVYDHTCYVKDGKDTDEAFYGAVVTAVDDDNNPGYASTDIIVKLIEEAVKSNVEAGDVTEGEGEDASVIGTYSGKETTLTSAKQLLYLDFSQLAGILQVTTDEHQSMDDYSNTNAENCLIFLPVGASAPNNNVAYKTLAGTFRTAHDIVLTDKQPFYSPYLIDMGENTVKYERKVTWEKYGATTKQSLILPFDLHLTNGTFSSGNTNFNVTKLTNADFADNAENENVTATFAKISGNTAPANTPYMVDITSPSDGTFVIEQIGGTIQPTTGMKSDYMFYDTEVGAKYNGADHTFYPRGSFSGKIYDAAEDDFRESNVFFYYGSKDMFRSSAALNSSYKNLYAYPFRSFYGYSAAPGAKMLSAFMFSYGSDETDGISEMTKRIDFAVRSGKGYLEITSAKDANVRIFNLSGILMGKELMTAGETRTVNLPAGVYIVNGVKIIVK